MGIQLPCPVAQKLLNARFEILLLIVAIIFNNSLQTFIYHLYS